ncbi:MAG: ATP-binding protein [Gammaproteobacteria bacterium]|nr:ATP-binding protein [Gammaproteobacteria bacterium]
MRLVLRGGAIEKYLPRSIKARVSLLFLAMTTVIALVVAGIIAWALRDHFHQTVRPHLEQYLEYVRADIGNPPDLARAHELAQHVPVEIMVQGPGVQWSSSGRQMNLDSINIRRRFMLNGVQYFSGDYAEREYLVTRYPESTLVFSVPHPHQEVGWRRAVPIIVLLILFFGFYHVMRYFFAPVATLKEGIQKIGSGALGHRIVVPRRDELGELAVSINAMADDIEKILSAKRELLLAISHELRSPLTRAKLSAAMVEDVRQRTDLELDLNEVDRLIEELLEAERLSVQHDVLHKSYFDLCRLVREVGAPFLAQGLIVSCDGGITVYADEVRIRLLVRNLLDNAYTHGANAARSPQISVEVRETGVFLQVSDEGCGVDATQLTQLAQPFYRADPARSRATGGYGLGLYLCRKIVEAHGGRLEITSEINAGLMVRAIFPRDSGIISAARE